jgi:hypothetical protein
MLGWELESRGECTAVATVLFVLFLSCFVLVGIQSSYTEIYICIGYHLISYISTDSHDVYASMPLSLLRVRNSDMTRLAFALRCLALHKVHRYVHV